MRAFSLLPTRTAHEQLRRNFPAVDWQARVGSVAEISGAVQSGSVMFERTDVVVIADVMPPGMITESGTSHLVHFVSQILAPEHDTVHPTPVVVLSTEPQATATLVAQIRAAAGPGVDLPLSVTPADMNCLHEHLRQVVPGYAEYPAPGNQLIFDTAVDYLAANRRAPVITVTSAKGGAGKTTTTLMLAFSAAYLAARSGNRMNVVIVELDLPGAVARSLVSTKRPAEEQRTILDYVNAAEATETALADAMETVVAVDGAGTRLMPEGSIRILLGPRRTMDAPNVDPRHVKEIVELLSRDPDIDLVLIDTSADVIDSPILETAFAVSDQLLYVIEDKPTSYAKMGETLMWLQKSMDVPAERMKVIVNKSVRTVADQTLRDDLVDHSSGVAALGVIPQSPFLHAFDGADTGSMWAAFFLEEERPLSDAFRSLVVALLPTPAVGLGGGPVQPAPKPAKRRRFGR